MMATRTQNYGLGVFQGAHAVGNAALSPIGLGTPADNPVAANTVLHLTGAAVIGAGLGYVASGYDGDAALTGGIFLLGLVGLGDAWASLREGKNDTALAAAVVGLIGTTTGLFLAKKRSSGGRGLIFNR